MGREPASWAAPGPVGDQQQLGPGPLPWEDILQKFHVAEKSKLGLQRVPLMEVCDGGWALRSPSKAAAFCLVSLATVTQPWGLWPEKSPVFPPAFILPVLVEACILLYLAQ